MKTDAWGIQTEYEDAAGNLQKVSKNALARIRAAMGPRPAAAPSWLHDRVAVIRQGESRRIATGATVVLEDGNRQQLTNRLPDDLPIGYHRLITSEKSEFSIRLLVTPGRCHLPAHLRIWGWSAQLYATRSRESWGIGDLADLRRLAQWAREVGARLLLINPLHATQPLVPQEASPYSPSSRRYLNPLYLRIEELPGVARLNQDLQRLASMGRALNEDRRIDRDRVFQLKQEALQRLWS